MNMLLHGALLRGPSLLPVSFETGSVAQTDSSRNENVKLELKNTFLIPKSTHY